MTITTAPLTTISFSQLSLDSKLLKAIEETGYTQATPIQKETIPVIIEGHDVIGNAQTGTGKTAAFAIPILQKLLTNGSNTRAIQALIIVPTRELALQVDKTFKDLSTHIPLNSTALFGGVPLPPQIRAVRQNPAIIVATPGRLLDLINQKVVSLSNINTLVLDEADQMLDMGFIHDLKKIMTHIPKNRQTLLFSATMPPAIESFANSLLNKPAKIQMVPPASTADTIMQEVIYVLKDDKKELLHNLLEENKAIQTLVFSRTKHGANNLVKLLDKKGIKSVAIHGNKSQGARTKALAQFKDKTVKVLIATDIAARGIDIEQLPLVINFDVPNIPETYVHRIGRTGRAGSQGLAITLCTPEEKKDLGNIQKLIGKSITVNKKYQ